MPIWYFVFQCMITFFVHWRLSSVIFFSSASSELVKKVSSKASSKLLWSRKASLKLMLESMLLRKLLNWAMDPKNARPKGKWPWFVWFSFSLCFSMLSRAHARERLVRFESLQAWSMFSPLMSLDAQLYADGSNHETFFPSIHLCS